MSWVSRASAPAPRSWLRGRLVQACVAIDRAPVNADKIGLQKKSFWTGETLVDGVRLPLLPLRKPPGTPCLNLATEVQEWSPIWLPGIKDPENPPAYTVKVCPAVTLRSRAFLRSLNQRRPLSSSRCNGGRDGHWQAWPVPHLNWE